MKKYKLITSWRNEIEEVDVVKETDSFVTLSNGNREAKNCKYYTYHDTYQDAYEKGEQKLIDRVNSALEEAEYHKNRLYDFQKKLKK